MGIITLTDRISVSVRAKNEAESNSQKRATGKNIANALGNGDISDSLADELGNTSKPTIADEQGREWVAMSDIIAAGKKMQQEGAFDGPEYDDYVHNGYHFLRTNSVAIVDVQKNYRDYYDNTQYTCDRISTTTYIGDCFTISSYREGDQTAYLNIMTVDPNDTLKKTIFVTRENISRPDIGVPSSTGPTEDPTYIGDSITGSIYARQGSMSPNAYGLQTGTLTRAMIQSLLNEQPIAHHGGSLIDWTKPDDEIEEDIRNLHETWDVSDHAGSTTANGTYVLAGPIEFNPGD